MEGREKGRPLGLAVKQRVSERFLFIHNLEEEITYTFSVRAQTIDYGPPVIGNVTTGPQEGSPRPIRNLVLSKEKNAILLSWTNSNSGRGPILGYYIESRRAIRTVGTAFGLRMLDVSDRAIEERQNSQ